MAKIRAEKHLLDVTQIEGLPEGFEGRVDDLFASWDSAGGAAAEDTIAEEDTEENSTLGEGKDGVGKDGHHDDSLLTEEQEERELRSTNE